MQPHQILLLSTTKFPRTLHAFAQPLPTSALSLAINRNPWHSSLISAKRCRTSKNGESSEGGFRQRRTPRRRGHNVSGKLSFRLFGGGDARRHFNGNLQLRVQQQQQEISRRRGRRRRNLFWRLLRWWGLWRMWRMWRLTNPWIDYANNNLLGVTSRFDKENVGYHVNLFS